MTERTDRAAESVHGSESTQINAFITLCIDTTGAMSGFSYEACRLPELIRPALENRVAELGCAVGELRVSFVFFKDYSCDCEPLFETEVFALPGDEEAMRDMLRHFTYDRSGGGGDLPESSLEAMFVALKRDGELAEPYRRVIGLYTDGPCRLPGDECSMSSPLYPEDMPSELESFYSAFASAEPEVRVCGYIPDGFDGHPGVMAFYGIPNSAFSTASPACFYDICAEEIVEGIVCAVFGR